MTLQRILPSTAILLALSLAGCGSSDNGTSGNGSGSSGTSGTTNIYLAGSTPISNTARTGNSVATYWKNGAATNLTGGMLDGSVLGIALSSK